MHIVAHLRDGLGHAGFAARLVLAVCVIRESLLFADFAEHAGARAAAQDHVAHHQRIVFGSTSAPAPAGPRGCRPAPNRAGPPARSAAAGAGISPSGAAGTSFRAQPPKYCATVFSMRVAPGHAPDHDQRRVVRRQVRVAEGRPRPCGRVWRSTPWWGSSAHTGASRIPSGTTSLRPEIPAARAAKPASAWRSACAAALRLPGNSRSAPRRPAPRAACSACRRARCRTG